MIPAPTEYIRPCSVEEALDALGQPEARVLAGGQSLLPAMKLRLARGGLLVDIGRLDLGGIGADNGDVRVGSLTTWRELTEAESLRRPALAAIAECASGIGDLQVRNRGTIGGSLAHADPASDMPAVMLVLGARLRLRSRDGERVVDSRDFFLGPFTTQLAQGELITEIAVPVPPSGSGSAYVSVEHPASGFAVAGAAALVRSGEMPVLALTGVSGRPFLLLADADPSEALAEVDVTADHFAPAEYRRHLAAVVCRRALEQATARAEEGT